MHLFRVVVSGFTLCLVHVVESCWKEMHQTFVVSFDNYLSSPPVLQNIASSSLFFISYLYLSA